MDFDVEFTVAIKKSEARLETGSSLSQQEVELSICNLEEVIKRHEAAVRTHSRERVCYRTVCAGCGKSPPFGPHGLRRRTLRYIVENGVVCVTIWLARWRCRQCGRIFTDYPDFRLAV